MSDSSGSGLTVAVPTFNGARHLAETLRSIRGQAGAEFDLLVCDDRSEDETIAIARRELGDRARVVIHGERLGLAGNWNHCIALSQTPLVAIFHQDDLMRPGHLARHLRAFQGHESLGFVCSAVEIVDDRGELVPASVIERPDLGPSDRIYPAGEFVAELVASNPVRCSAVTIRKQAHQEIGGFDPSYRFAVDWEFWQRLARQRAVAWLAEPTVAVRWHPGSETQRFRRGVDDLEEVARVIATILQQDGPTIPNAASKRRQANRRLSRAYLNRAYEALRAGDPDLARHSLGCSIQLNKGILGTLLLDPKLALAAVALGIAPGPASRWIRARAAHQEGRMSSL